MSTYSDSRLSAELQAKSDRIMTPEEFTQVVEAILQGRYSWACVLILRSAGYNPLHYIPYRTYKRIVKENRQDGKEALNRSSANSEYHPLHSSNCLSEHPFDPMTAPR